MGDGAFGFACGELETICRAKAPITFVVFSNASYGWIKASQRADKGARYYNVDFDPTDQAAIAAAFGVRAWRVEDPQALEGVLREAIAHDGPTLVDVVTQPLEEANAPVRRWMG
jgi:acetolactate synthase-1/2/3 large subunit